MRRLQLVFTVALVTLAIGCSTKNPTAPTAPAVTRLAITGIDAVLTGLTTSYVVTATSADGTSRTVTPTWSSSKPEVASVDSTGRLEGRAHGSTIVTASASGQTVSKTVQVVNNYGGTWEGRFIVKACDAPPGVCADLEVDVFSFPIYLEMSQTGTDLSDIKATLMIPSWFDGAHADISGRVSSNGRLNLAGSSELISHGRTWATFTVEAWDTALSDDGMTGRWTQRLSNRQPPSTEYMDNELKTMKRISNTADGMPR